MLYQPVQRTVTITNNGQKNMIVAGAQITGSSMFNVIDWTGMRTVAPGDTMTLSVVFTPTSPGLQTATLGIAYNAAAPNPQTVNVSLTGSGF
jgi:hypothetical protein